MRFTTTDLKKRCQTPVCCKLGLHSYAPVQFDRLSEFGPTLRVSKCVKCNKYLVEEL